MMMSKTRRLTNTTTITSFLLVLATLVSSVAGALAPPAVPTTYSIAMVYSKNKVKYETVTLKAPSLTSIARLRAQFVEDFSGGYVPPICAAAATNKELSSIVMAETAAPTAPYKGVFVRHWSKKESSSEKDPQMVPKMYLVTVCPGTKYSDLKQHVSNRLKVAKIDLAADKIAFTLINNNKEDEEVAEMFNIRARPFDAIVPFDVTRHKFLEISDKNTPRNKPIKLEQLTGQSLEIEIPGLGKTSIENVDLKGTVGKFREALETRFGADAGYHKTLAVCNRAGAEAKDSDELKATLPANLVTTLHTITVVDWTSGKRKQERLSYCPQSTFEQAFKRGLPSWKSVIGEKQAMYMYMYTLHLLTKRDDDEKGDGMVRVSVPNLKLTAKIDPTIQALPLPDQNEPRFYAIPEGAKLINLSGKRVCLANGADTTLTEIRKVLVDEIGHDRAWQFAFCEGRNELGDSTMVPADNRLVNTSFSSVFSNPKAVPQMVHKMPVLILPNDNPKDHKSVKFDYCLGTTVGQLKGRVHGLMKLSASSDKVYFSRFVFGVGTTKSLYAPILDDELVFIHRNEKILIATINHEQPADYAMKPSWIQPYFSTMTPFSATLIGLVSLNISNIDPLMRVGDFRKKLLEDNAGQIESDRMRRYPFCVPEDIANDKVGLEMEDEKTFSHYGFEGSNSYVFETKEAWFVDWTQSSGSKVLKVEERVVEVCLRSTYKQVALRSVDDHDAFRHSMDEYNFLVDDEKPASGKEPRKTLQISPWRPLDPFVIHEGTSKDKDKSMIKVMPKRMAVVSVGGAQIPVPNPANTPVSVIRDYFVEKDKKGAYKMAYCANMEWMFWEAKEMDEQLSFKRYGINPDSWETLGKPKKTTIRISTDTVEEAVEFEYCPMSTVEDIKQRVMKYKGVDPDCQVTIHPASTLDLPKFYLWSATGDTNFMPKLAANIGSPSKKAAPIPKKPVDKQRKRAVLQPDLKKDDLGGGASGASGGGGDKGAAVPAPVSKSDLEMMLEAFPRPASLDDPTVIRFTKAPKAAPAPAAA
jgi:hypothetical protein